QDFSYRLPKVATALRYRFRAGDAPTTGWFPIATRPAPAFSAISVEVAPPAYMRLRPQTGNPRNGRLIVPAGSEVRITATANTALKAMRLFGVEKESIPLSAAGEATVWKGTASLFSGTSMTLKGDDTYGSSVKEDIAYVIEPDKAPGIEIVAPLGRAVLP